MSTSYDLKYKIETMTAWGRMTIETLCGKMTVAVLEKKRTCCYSSSVSFEVDGYQNANLGDAAMDLPNWSLEGST